MSVLIKGLNIKPCKDSFNGKGLVIVGYDDKIYAVAHEQIIPLPDHGEWILCSDRLPEANGRYLATRGLKVCGAGALWNKVYILNYTDLMSLKSERIWWDGNVGKSDFKQFDDVLAWMPLPKPYKEANNRND